MIPYTYLIEIKYLTTGNCDEEEIKKALTEAENQLQRYVQDAKVICLALVFCGWELVRVVQC